ncbi:putative transcriptional regulator [Bacillus thermophilus]|uniref:Transcriptional regulator n=2 Tax=Siminovitchia TaxID=2837510 RepID=A0ABS2R1S2_9BACI|nr:hypothetical protein [Siminovitchia thermophila]MBM7713519.1 putative transcriptional regulator [Siminovitchia thermophila]
MVVKVGYIGTAHSVRRIRKLAESLPGIKLITYIYETPTDVKKLHQQATQETDVVCFSGIVSYYYRDKALEGAKPVTFPPFHEYMIVASIMKCLLHDKIHIHDISIDLPNRDALERLSKDIDFQLHDKQIYVYQWIYDDAISKDFNFKEIANFHLERYRSGQTKMAITSVHFVYDMLKKQHIPVIYMVDNDQIQEEALYDAYERVLFSRLQDGMIAVMYLSLQDNRPFSESDYDVIYSYFQPMVSFHQSKRLKLKNKHMIVLISTRGFIEKNLLDQANKNWLTELERNLDKQIYFGVGYGRQLIEAEENAGQAVQIALSKKEGNGYILTETKEKIGPVFGETKHENIRMTDEWMQQIAHDIKANMKTLQRFFSFMKTIDFQPFTVNELAAYTQVSIRTSERFVKRLYEAGYIELYGQEQSYHIGRPRQVYILRKHIETALRRRLGNLS